MVPWLLLVIILAATMTMALVMSWLPSRQAARIAPAEALRYE
jgi:ABC-type lipoprotein release transport system permease subunit